MPHHTSDSRNIYFSDTFSRYLGQGEKWPTIDSYQKYFNVLKLCSCRYFIIFQWLRSVRFLFFFFFSEHYARHTAYNTIHILYCHIIFHLSFRCVLLCMFTSPSSSIGRFASHIVCDAVTFALLAK